MEVTCNNYIGKTIIKLSDVDAGALVKGILTYETTGDTPTFADAKVSGLFKRIVNSITPEHKLVNVVCSQEDRNRLMELLDRKSYLFDSTEASIIKTFLEKSWERKEKYQDQPFLCTTNMLQQKGFDYAIVTNLRNFLKGEKVMEWEKRQSGTYQYQVTYYAIDEPKLLELVANNIEQ